jgi:serine phosphatase RsbU (regulator of sigma subunit)
MKQGANRIGVLTQESSRQYSRGILFCILVVSFLFNPFDSIQANDRKVVDSLEKVMASTPDPLKKCIIHNNLGLKFMELGRFDSSRIYFDQAIKIAIQAKRTKSLSAFYINKGNSYLMQGNFTDALKNYLLCVSLREEQKDSLGLCNAYNSVGIVYYYMNMDKMALDFLEKSLALSLRLNQEASLLDLYSNLGALNSKIGNVDKGLNYFLKAIVLADKDSVSTNYATISANIASAYLKKKQYQLSLSYLDAAHARGADQLNDGLGSPEIYVSYGSVYKELKEYKKAEENYVRGLRAAKSMHNFEMIVQLYLGESELAADEKDYAKAFEYHQLYAQYNDSIYNKQNLDKINDLRAGYEVEKKEQELKSSALENDLKQQVQNRRRKWFEYVLVSSFVVLAILAFFIYRGYLIKKKSTAIILHQKREIEEKNQELQQVHTDVSDSIAYASRIQQAILPPLNTIQNAFPESFVLFLPKDVVSGDFYYFNISESGDVLVAACDCTGHGVPGAFMSMIGSEQLEKIINHNNIRSPGLILDNLHQGVRNALQQDRNESRDGMDLALCKINAARDKLEYAGANRPVWIVSAEKSILRDLKPDKRAIGGLEYAVTKSFETRQEHLSQGDTVYLFSDGYADQFGGEKGKKFMLRRFQELLLAISHHPMAEQQKIIHQRFLDWKGPLDQVDDILIVGMRV